MLRNNKKKRRTMLPETENSYRKLAINFYKVHMQGQRVTEASILSCLRNLAPNFQPGYFRRLKNAVAFDQKERGFPDTARLVLALRNPVTQPGSTLPRKPKRPKAKSFSDDDFARLARHMADHEYHEELAAVTLVRFTGARPAELKNIRLLDGKLFIRGAKKSHNGVRGADRILQIEDAGVLEIITTCLLVLRSSTKSKDAIRNRIRQEARKLWPRRKVLPSLYSMRHQVGANLKASNLKAREIAYIMGHQSTNSVSCYGNKRQGDPTAIHVRPATEADLAQVRTKVKPSRQLWIEQVTFRARP